MSDFDPYHKWLGISPQHQPPNHYRLLSLDLYESDPDVIEASVDRASAFLQDVATGPHARESQRLLNEIAAARLCLLDAANRAAYDAKLRAELAEPGPPPAVSSPPPSPAMPAISIDTSAGSATKPRDPRKSARSAGAGSGATNRPLPKREPSERRSKRTSPWLLLSFGSAGGLIVAVLLYALLVGGDARQRADDEARIRERYDSFARMGHETESALPDFKPNYEANTDSQPQPPLQTQKQKDRRSRRNRQNKD